MTVFIIVIHVIACIVLIALVLIQRGRGSGLVESFQGVESMFGTKTNTFLTRTTTILSVVFFITCLSLALISIRQSRSLMTGITAQKPTAEGQAPQAKQEQAKPVSAPVAAKPEVTISSATAQTQEKPAQAPPPAAEKPKELPKTE